MPLTLIQMSSFRKLILSQQAVSILNGTVREKALKHAFYTMVSSRLETPFISVSSVTENANINLESGSPLKKTWLRPPELKRDLMLTQPKF